MSITLKTLQFAGNFKTYGHVHFELYFKKFRKIYIQWIIYVHPLRMSLAKEHRNWVFRHVVMDISLIFADFIDDLDDFACMLGKSLSRVVPFPKPMEDKLIILL